MKTNTMKMGTLLFLEKRKCQLDTKAASNVIGFEELCDLTKENNRNLKSSDARIKPTINSIGKTILKY